MSGGSGPNSRSERWSGCGRKRCRSCRVSRLMMTIVNLSPPVTAAQGRMLNPQWLLLLQLLSALFKRVARQVITPLIPPWALSAAICSPHVFVVFLRVLHFPSALWKHASSVCVCLYDCLSALSAQSFQYTGILALSCSDDEVRRHVRSSTWIIRWWELAINLRTDAKPTELTFALTLVLTWKILSSQGILHWLMLMHTLRRQSASALERHFKRVVRDFMHSSLSPT